MKVLVACEYSGAVRDAFIAAGHNAMSCDLLPTDSPGPHHQGDVAEILDRGWDLLIAHPPCTYLCNSGVRWLKTDLSRWGKMEAGCDLFLKLWNAPVPRICIENQVMHGYAKKIIGSGPAQSVQPWMFGHGETKRTCFWLKGLPKLKPTDVVAGREQRIWKLPPTADRWKIRSQTYTGIAKAMAEQWGSLRNFPLDATQLPMQQFDLL